MTAVAAVTTAMASRPSGSMQQRFADYTVFRDDKEVYFGSDGDVALIYASAKDLLRMGGRGSHLEARGLNQGKDRVCLEERFLRAPKINADIQAAAEATREIANPDFEVLGVNAVSADVVVHVEGGASVATHGATNDSTIIAPHLDANQSAWTKVTWGTDQETRWECSFKTPAAITGLKMWMGLKLTNTDVIATDNDQVYFRFDSVVHATDVHSIYSIGGVDTDAAIQVSAANVILLAATKYHVAIEIDSSRIARFYWDGVLVTTSTALTTATDLIPYFGILDTSAGSARTCQLYHMEMSRLAA